MRVAFLGPEGTFAEEALRASAPAGVDEVPYATVYETVMAVHDGDADRAVVPIENSLEGSVTTTLDALAGEAERVRIVAEVVRPIEHCLAARPGLGLDDVRLVVSHPQAIAQCAGFLRERLPDAATATATSTAEAVRVAARSADPVAALGPRLAAEMYGCELLAEGVQDAPDNLTRFVWLAPEGAEPVSAPTKTSIVFWGFNDESPGALVGVLGELAERGVNLTKIESRPRRVRLGHYMFFADLEGAAGDAGVSEALSALSERVQTLKVLGSYPVLDPDSPR
ncbi:MAG TPA: prephenate dehydratase [Thermoleophilaceae bacterium]|nr:prephenate dehydratase [Thermoleophilaceae bacterium]